MIKLDAVRELIQENIVAMNHKGDTNNESHSLDNMTAHISKSIEARKETPHGSRDVQQDNILLMGTNETGAQSRAYLQCFR